MFSLAAATLAALALLAPSAVTADKKALSSFPKGAYRNELPTYFGKPAGRELDYADVSKYDVSIGSYRSNNQTSDFYKFFFTTLGAPRFWSSLTNVTRNEEEKFSFNVSSWSYDLVLFKLFEFEDTGDAGYDNETVLSELKLGSFGRSKGWSAIDFQKTTLDGVTSYGFSTNLTVNYTSVRIDFNISSEQIRAVLEDNTIFQPNSIKWTVSINNYTYAGNNSQLAFVALIRSEEKAVRVTRDYVNRNETVIHHNKTLPANEFHFSINNGTGRFAFTSNVTTDDGAVGTVLVSAPLALNESYTIDSDEQLERRQRVGRDIGSVNDCRQSRGEFTRVVFTFQTEANPSVLVWDPETYIADSSDANSLTATELQAAINSGSLLFDVTSAATTVTKASALAVLSVAAFALLM